VYFLSRAQSGILFAAQLTGSLFPGLCTMNSYNPFESLEAKLDQLLKEVRTLNARTNAPPPDEVGGMELAMALTGLSRSTIYKRTHRREIPHLHVGGRLYFRRSELEAWLDTGRRPLAKDTAHERMALKK
jgi:excisionase family DNA binding protein